MADFAESFDFSQLVDRRNSWCTQWDYVADRFAEADLLPFTISDMDYPVAPCVLAALHERVNHGVFGYSRWQNQPFIQAVSGWFARRFAWQIDSDMLVYSPSVIYMVAQMIRQWSDIGDAVVLHTPAYDAFYQTISANQRRVLSVPLTALNGQWHYDEQTLIAQLSRPESKILLLCHPHNPTGKVWSEAELRSMAALCQQYGVKVISDEIHMDMVWQGRHIPWCAVAQTPFALCTSASKSFNFPALGGSCGLISELTDRTNWFTALKKQNGLSSPAVLSLVAHVAAYQHGAAWLDALREYLWQNQCYVAEQLNQAFSELACFPPQATYLAWLDLRPLGIDDTALQHELVHRQKVAIMPGIVYGAEGFLRLNVGCPRSKLAEGLRRLISAIQQVRQSQTG